MPAMKTLLQPIFESIPVGVIVFDASGTIRVFSPAAERLLGYSAADVEGMSAIHFIAPQDRERFARYIDRYRESGVSRLAIEGAEVKGLRKDGSIVELHVAVGQFQHEDEQLFTGVLHDISKEVSSRMALEASETRFHQLADSIGEMFALRTVAPRQYVYVNRAVEKIYGVRVEDVLADANVFFDVVHPDDTAKVRAAMKEADQGVSTSVEFRLIVEGEVRWIVARYTPVEAIHDGRALVAVTVTNITSSKLAQDALQSSREEADRANGAKSEFLSRMSHELRTPLNAILGFAQLLAMDELTEDQSESVHQITQGGQHLLNLINDVLDISRVETGQMAFSLENVLVADVLSEALDLIQPMASQRRIRVNAPTGDLERTVVADRQRLKQVLLNLLSNAIKYNREEGEIDVVGVDEGERFRLTVSDTGVGIPGSEMGRLFTPFDRLGAEATGVEGTGVGLALCRQLVDMMNGSIDAESTLGVGSRFNVHLPKRVSDFDATRVRQRRRQEAPPNASEDAGTNGGPVNIVYIEDNLANVNLVEQVATRQAGINVFHSLQGRVGLDLIASLRPNLVLLDLHLPDISGEEILRLVRADAATAQIPVVIVSADATHDRLKRLSELGATGYITKPFDVQILFEWFRWASRTSRHP